MNLRRVRAITRRILSQFRRDHRTMALLLVVPVFVMGLLGWIVGAQVAVVPRVAVAAEDALIAPLLDAAFTAADEAGDIVYVGLVADEAAGRQVLVDDDADLLLVVPEGTREAILGGQQPTIQVITPGLDPIGDATNLIAVQKVVAQAIAGARGGVVPAPSVERITIYGSPEATQLDAFGPVFVGFFAYFFVFLLTGVSFLRERTGGTLERLLATPVTRGEIVSGYSLGFGIAAAAQVAVMLTFVLADVQVPAIGPIPAFGIGLGLYNAGNPLLVFLVVLLLAIGAVNLGIFLSTFARTELQVIQFIPVVIIPQALLSGLLWPIDQLPEVLQPIARVMPLTYGLEGLRAVMLRGASLEDPTLQLDVAVLAGIAIVVMMLATRTIRRETA
ncbi:MAG: ABC transporter permease [Chloroflexi bacterium]|jgi:ABC-2 type transport system permease protein|nr:ABC transporter permease [Chloroflexota bacterium]